ncbi:hypothetical protein BFP76_02740 [Amylibacter kogurei]|uniref:Uncharacterized protein n=1 Tax=Paramylibacter kogurei TaxID=1889778 RepID=A0A2G5K415_9RHOB|nr:hypothetical protein [Amylibacter kogurei]PIB24165.1 hypothetical protein BFP76_02740 [Amylibacter kogurei]
MNRRQFSLALGASAALPNMPLASSAPTIKTLGAKSAQYAHLWGRGIAQARPDISAKTLSSILQISETAAQDVMQHLIKTNVITTTKAKGVYQTIRPNNGMINHFGNKFDPSDIQKLAQRVINEPDETKIAPMEECE